MGLDSIWIMPGEQEIIEKYKNDDSDGTQMWIEREALHPNFEPELRICGGMCSGHGFQSFRGKVYAELIEEQTGISLYQDELSNEQVKEIADVLDNWIEDVSNQESKDFVRMFRAYADAGATLRGWW